MASKKEKHIFLVHGRNFKPEKERLYGFWQEALKFGIEKDFGKETAKKFADTRLTAVYYGDLSNQFLRDECGKTYDEEKDVDDRRRTLDELKRYDRADFKNKKAGKIYNRLPGKTEIPELLADMFGGVAAHLHLSEYLIAQVAPDMRKYWNRDDGWGE